MRHRFCLSLRRTTSASILRLRRPAPNPMSELFTTLPFLYSVTVPLMTKDFGASASSTASPSPMTSFTSLALVSSLRSFVLWSCCRTHREHQCDQCYREDAHCFFLLSWSVVNS